MNPKLISFRSAICAIVMLTTLTSCTEDWLNHHLDSLIGEWCVVETSGYSNYRSGDIWKIYANGDFYVDAYPDFTETGYWNADHRTISISFDGYNTDISAYIRQCNDSYMVLDVTDYTYGTQYTLRFVRNHMYFSPKK